MGVLTFSAEVVVDADATASAVTDDAADVYADITESTIPLDEVTQVLCSDNYTWVDPGTEDTCPISLPESEIPTGAIEVL